MKPYFFGYLFVRLAKVLATLIFVAGLAVAAFTYLQASLESRENRYASSGTLGMQLRLVQRLQAEAQDVVAGFPSTGDQPPPRLNLAELAAFSQTPPTSLPDFAKLETVLERIQANDTAMKQFLLAQFEASIADIRSQLLAHAQELNPATPASAATAPTSIPPAPDLPAAANGIYSAQLSNSEIRERNAALNGVRNTLQVLAAQAEKMQNKQTLLSSITSLDNLQSLLPVATLPPSPSSNATEREDASSTPARGPRAAELVAARLQHLVAEVRRIIGSSWASTDAAEQAVQSAGMERRRCQTAEFSLKRIWQHAFGVMLSAALGGAFLAFLLLAMTDLTKALLDAATHSGVVADVYRAAAAPAAQPEETMQSET